MLKRDKLLNACITGEGDIFHELKKLLKVNDNITGHFAHVYERI